MSRHETLLRQAEDTLLSYVKQGSTAVVKCQIPRVKNLDCREGAGKVAQIGFASDLPLDLQALQCLTGLVTCSTAHH